MTAPDAPMSATDLPAAVRIMQALADSLDLPGGRYYAATARDLARVLDTASAAALLAADRREVAPVPRVFLPGAPDSPAVAAARTEARLRRLAGDATAADALDGLLAELAALPEWSCPACGATTRARMADHTPTEGSAP